jgi:hypothetical protein
MRYLAVVLALVLTACSGGDSNSPPDDANIGGRWAFSRTMSDPAHGLSYVGSGEAVISQSGNQFSGTFDEEAVLSGPGGTIDASGSGSFGSGQIDGNAMSFNAGTCGYNGTASGSPTNRMEGNVSCTLDVQGQRITFAGEWQAGR